MNVKSIKSVSFSPTGSTAAVLGAMARGMGIEDVETIDLTRPEVRSGQLKVAEDELLLIGVPVYMGRVPGAIGAWLEGLELDGSPAVCVAVYGNRHYDDALVELHNVISGRGGSVAACAAYVAEHSFSAPDLPTAQGRPDADDLAHAESFGQKIRERLDSVAEASGLPKIAVPGEYPSERGNVVWDEDFIVVDDNCVQCGLCAQVCPMGAVDPEDSRKIDPVPCISCCACIKRCPQNARSVKPGRVMEARKRLNSLFSEPRQPEWFF